MFNIDQIINGTPYKRLLNGYDKMKQNYTESSAQEFLNTYNNEPLSFLLENSRMIFSEPYFGCNFYKEAVLNNACCGFTYLEKEYDKVQEYIEENGSLMNESQKNIYEELESSLKALLEHTKNTRIFASYIKENIDDRFEEKLSNLVFEYCRSEEKDDTNIINLFEATSEPVIFFTYAPYVMTITESTSLYGMVDVMQEKASVPESYDEKQWTTFVESVICGNKLTLDKAYVEAVNHIGNRDIRFVFEYFMNTSLDKKLLELKEERVKEDRVLHSSKVSAINNIFFDIQEASIDQEMNNKFKEEIDVYKGIVYESSLNILVTEYQNCNNTDDIAEGYSILTEAMTLEKAFENINNLYSESVIYMTEAKDESEEDVTDEDIDSIDVEDREVGGSVPGKKPQAPKPKNLANKVQINAMDKEAKWWQKKSIRKQKGQEVKNAANAVTAIPRNVVQSIKDQVRKIDEVDDQRRKDFMTEPGFRKKAFRNLKLAILYGSAAQAKLALVPTVALCRHFSKKKDRRIRNELIREIQTEIKVCEEKISDANARSDEKEKYRLIRIKDRLEAELVRVKTNSKYV